MVLVALKVATLLDYSKVRRQITDFIFDFDKGDIVSSMNCFVESVEEFKRTHVFVGTVFDAAPDFELFDSFVDKHIKTIIVKIESVSL